MTMEDSPLEEALRALIRDQIERGDASLRARRVADFLMEHGSMSTTDLEELGYSHPPRAIRDLRDAGVELSTTMEGYTTAQGLSKRRARYRVVDIVEWRASRKTPTKRFTDAVKSSGRCAVCGTTSIPLQADHRVPFEVGGEAYPHVLVEWQALCASCNRAKSWTCEHCDNWGSADPEVCQTCLWASPDDYGTLKSKSPTPPHLDRPPAARATAILFSERHISTLQEPKSGSCAAR